MNDHDTSRRLWRIDSDYISLVARGYDGYCIDYGCRRNVYLDFAPSEAFGVALF